MNPPLPGPHIDAFKVVRLLGRGGMGEVYLARDTKLGRKVALKIVRPDALGDTRAVDRFLFEARTTARFSHPHIVTIYAVGEFDGSPYVALEYLEGQTLRERMDSAKVSVREAMRIGSAVASALREAHRHQVLHRDLKPENVLLPTDGRLRVVDFGLAKMVEPSAVASIDEFVTFDSPSNQSNSGLAGTPLYMAPEQWLQYECSPATDIWALGTILWELVCGVHPFGTTKILHLCAQVCSHAPSPKLQCPDPVPPQLQDLIHACMSKAPQDRPSADDVAAAASSPMSA